MDGFTPTAHLKRTCLDLANHYLSPQDACSGPLYEPLSRTIPYQTSGLFLWFPVWVCGLTSFSKFSYTQESLVIHNEASD